MSVTQATFAATLADEWVRAGVTDVVVCPGSRSAPLALALAAQEGLRLHVRLDERGAGFFALGLGLATGRPAVVCTTSGTAAVELHPAVVEAHHARVPLVVCTADRPPELQGVGAPQTIEQTGLYGRAVRWSAEPGVADEATRTTWRSLAARSVAEATAGPAGPGPVHLNLAFREPLVGEPGPLPAGRPAGLPFHGVVAASGDEGAGGDAVRSWAGRSGVLVAGAGAGPPELLTALGERLGWPVLADPRSGARTDHPSVVGAVDALLRCPEVADELRPEVAVLLGSAWASKALAGWLESCGTGVEVATVDPWWRWADPPRLSWSVHRADPATWLAGALAAAEPADDRLEAWGGRWRAVETAAQEAIDRALGDPLAGGPLTEPALARGLLGLLEPGTVVVASSSMPVRDLEWYAPPMAAPPRVLANRGANGIDGVCSTAVGVAAAGTGAVVGLVGDLAFLHDVSALVGPAGGDLPRCTLVVVDNRGGGIFDFLPQAQVLGRDRFEQLFGTPMRQDVAEVAAGFGWEVADAGTFEELAAALAPGRGARVVRARVPDRVANVAEHERVHRAVAEAAMAALDRR